MELGLTDVQQREMVRVLLHCSANVCPPLAETSPSAGSAPADHAPLFFPSCSLQEKLYNPYYTLVLARLLQLHAHRFTFQYSLWDFFRELGEGDVGGTEVVRAFKESGGKAGKGRHVAKRHVRNWAKAYGWCIAKEGTTLAILKPINFTRLRPASAGFLQQLLIALILASQTASPLLILPSTRLADLDPTPLKEVVMKVANLPDLCEGLLYFLQTSLTDDGAWLDSLGEGEKQVAVWGREVLRDELLLGLEGRMDSAINDDGDDDI
jgi:nucleolar MIF4G domain-containing protein 1